MIHALESNLLYAEINDQGAELYSLYSKQTKTEYLWQGKPDIWGQRAPVLFPIVGRLKDGMYMHNGKAYKMPPHGFVSSAQFSAEPTEDNSLILSCEDTKESRAMYPFAFSFNVIFTVKWNVIETIYEVVNKTNGSMYFSFGSHEGYRCPRFEGEAFEDYYLEFDHDGIYSSHKLSPEGLLLKETYPLIEGRRQLSLNYGLFDNDSLVFANVPSGKVALCSRKSASRLEIEYDDAPNLVVWTKPQAPFVCIEPWHGLPDFEDSEGQLSDKKGIITLEKGASFNWRHTISIYEKSSFD